MKPTKPKEVDKCFICTFYIPCTTSTFAKCSKTNEETQIDEVLTKKTPASDVISDFVHSKDPKFAGKSKKERIRMALGAFYAAKKGAQEELEAEEENLLTELGEPMSAAPATSDSPSVGGDQSPSTGPDNSSDSYDDDDDESTDEDEGDMPKYKRQLEDLALTAAQLFELLADSKDLDQEAEVKIDNACNDIQEIYANATKSTQDTTDDSETDDNTSPKPDATKTVVPSMAKEQVEEKYVGFEKLKKSIAAKGGAKDPGAVAAAIGRKKYGKRKFQAMAAAGKKHHKEEVTNVDEALGLNRPRNVGRETKAAENALKKHASLMKTYMDQGMEKSDASKKAFSDLSNKSGQGGVNTTDNPEAKDVIRSQFKDQVINKMKKK